MENLKKYAFSVVAGDADLEAPREKIEGTPKHSCQWRDLNIRRAGSLSLSVLRETSTRPSAA